MPDNKLETMASYSQSEGTEQRNALEVIIPDPEPNPAVWAVTEMSYRAVLSAEDLQPGEILVAGEPPVIQLQRADAALRKTQLLALATEKIAPLQDAMDLDMVTADEIASLLAWKKFRVLLNRVDVLQAPDIVWPERPVP